MTKNYAEEKKYITSTNKCVVSVLCLDPNDPNGINKIMIPVTNADEVSNLKKPVTKSHPRKPLPSHNQIERNFLSTKSDANKAKEILEKLSAEQKSSSVIISLMDKFNSRNVCSKNVITINLMLNIFNKKICECSKQDKNLNVRKTLGQNSLKK